MKNILKLLPILICSVILLKCTGQSGKQTTEQTKTAHASAELPTPPKPEPFELSTIPLPDSVMDAVLVNYLPDYEHIIMEVRFRGKEKSDLAIMKDDGSGFTCLTYDLKEELGGEMPCPLPNRKTVYTPT